jgi:hypothetical protein
MLDGTPSTTANTALRPRPNSRVTSRQIDGNAGASTPESLEAATCDPCVMDRVLWIPVPKVILDQAQIISPVGEVEAT